MTLGNGHVGNDEDDRVGSGVVRQIDFAAAAHRSGIEQRTGCVIRHVNRNGDGDRQRLAQERRCGYSSVLAPSRSIQYLPKPVMGLRPAGGISVTVTGVPFVGDSPTLLVPIVKVAPVCPNVKLPV